MFKLRWLAAGVAALGVAATAAADVPRLNPLTPNGGQRGSEIELVLSGGRLAEPQELLWYEPGLRTVKLEPQKDGAVKARVAIAADCRVGYHGLRVRTAGGVSNLQIFSVGVLPEIQEVEPNSDFAKPQKIPLNVTVNGVVQNEDVDYYVVEAKKGQRLTAEVEGIRLGETFFDPAVAILNTSRFVLASADDTPLLLQDAAVTAVAPADGSYVIEVRESAFGGSPQCRYRLHVGTCPRPLGGYPAGGRPGQALDVRWVGDAAGEWTERIALPKAPDGAFGVLAHDAQGTAPTPNVVRVVDLNNVLESEPNEAPAQATAGEAPVAFNGIISKSGDVDHFKFPAKKGTAFDVRVHARSIRSPLDPVLTVLRSGGAGVGSSDDTDTPDSYLRFTAPEDDQYIIQVRDHLNQGGPEYVYRVEVTPVQPRLTMGLPERNQFEDIVAAVPAGNRTALLLSAQREDLGGEVKLELKGLPPGVTAEFLSIPAEDSTVPVLLSAAADAKLAGALVDVIGRQVEPSRTVEGHLRQRSSLVRGQNNIDVRSFPTERLAVGVTQSVPFQIEIVEPKVPLVQSGAMELKVLAKRSGGFKAPITLRMLYNPPGVSTPTSVAIPEGQNETIVPLTAEAGAPVRKWKVVLLGEAVVDGAACTVSTQLAKLEVAEPFVKFAFPVVSVDQGQQAELAIKVEKKKDFAGPAKVELLGLPNEVTAEPREITKDTGDLRFTVKTTAQSPVGRHKTVLCRAVVQAEGQPITHLLGSGELRIEKPLPPKPAAAKPEPKPVPVAAAPAKPAEKVLSRLEKLRQDRQQGPK